MDPLDVRAAAIAQVQVSDPDLCRSVGRWPLTVEADGELKRLAELAARWPAHGLPDVLASIRANPAVVELSSYNVRGLRDDHVAMIVQALPSLKQLQTIDLRRNSELTDAGVRLLLPVLPGTAVTAVHLSHGAGVSASVRAEIRDAVLLNILAPVRASDATLRILSLRDMELRDEQVDVIVDAFQGNVHTTTLDLRSNPALTDAGAQRLLPLPEASALTELSLAGCGGISESAKDRVAAAFAAKRLGSALTQDLAGVPAPYERIELGALTLMWAKQPEEMRSLCWGAGCCAGCDGSARRTSAGSHGKCAHQHGRAEARPRAQPTAYRRRGEGACTCSVYYNYV